MRRSLNDVLREARKETISKPEKIEACVEAMGKITLYELAQAGGHLNNEEPFDNYILTAVVISYDVLMDLSDDEIKKGLKAVTLRDFACMVDYLNEKINPNLKEELMSGFSLDGLYRMSVKFLGTVFEDAKEKGFKEAKKFARINLHNLDEMLSRPHIVRKKDDQVHMLGEYFTKGAIIEVFKLCREYDIRKAIVDFYSDAKGY